MKDTGIFSTEIWQTTMFTIAGLYAIFLMFKNKQQLLNGSRWQLYGLLITVAAWWYIGTRPIWCYADTGLYTTMFNLVKHGYWSDVPDAAKEWFWNIVEDICIKYTDASGWLMVIAGMYIGGMCFAAWRWMRTNYTLAVMFLFTAFSFWGYATNGIRQGVAGSLIMAGLALVTPQVHKNWLKLWPAILLIIIGCGTHGSMWLAVAASAFAFIFPSRRNAFIIWTVCLLLSPFSSDFFIQFGGSFIDDGRLTYYGLQAIDAQLFNNAGWRWDFILYSAMPILLGWYIVFRRKIHDWTYLFILNTYTYTNAAWMLINDVPYSNRFAYISWFLYPIVLCYPLSKFDIWKKQNVWTGFILIGSIIFTLIFTQ